MRNDVRYALRLIRSHRWFSAAIVATLALGIGVNTTVFTLVNAVLFKPLPFPGGERLVVVSGTTKEGNGQTNVSYPDFRQFRSQTSTFEDLEAIEFTDATISEQGNPADNYDAARVSPGLFRMLHTPPVLGRGFTAADGAPGAETVVLLGYGAWTSRYGNSPDVLQRVVRLNGEPAAIIGVMPQGFRFPNREDLWIALKPTSELEDRSRRTLTLFGMMKPDVSMSEATADLNVIAARLANQFPDTNKDLGAMVQTLHQRQNGGNIRMIFLLMMASVGFVLLIACANVANMMLSRALARRREVSIRAAMGASRWQIIRQLLIESLLLSLMGGALGLGLAALGAHAFDLATVDVGRPYWIDFSMNYVVFGYCAAICLLSGILFGLVPAFQTSKVDLNTALKDGTRTAGSTRGGKLSTVLVVFQFTLAVVLLAGAGLFARSFLAQFAINPWIPSDHILTASLRLPSERYPDTRDRLRFYDQLLPRLAALPAVREVAAVSNPPAGGYAASREVEIEGTAPSDTAQWPQAGVVVQTPGYFGVIDLPLLAGRDFEETDGVPGREAAVVTRGFAERFWPNQGAVGRRFRFHTDDGPGKWITVVGVSTDLSQRPQDINTDPLLFLPFRQDSNRGMTLMVHTAGEPGAVVSALRAEVQRLDQDLPVGTRSLKEVHRRQFWFLAVFGTVFAVFALLALLMASVGIYAVMAQNTGRRTQEIGVRMALGASSRGILRLVLARGLKQLGAGLVLGLAGAFGATRLLRFILLGISPTDPVVFVGVPLLLVAVGLFACWLPARRAAALHPVKALRYE